MRRGQDPRKSNEFCGPIFSSIKKKISKSLSNTTNETVFPLKLLDIFAFEIHDYYQPILKKPYLIIPQFVILSPEHFRGPPSPIFYTLTFHGS